ncbi:MAG: hypothetical protein ACRDGL_06445 [Candidatus Limnocylindrales bacterium]
MTRDGSATHPRRGSRTSRSRRRGAQAGAWEIVDLQASGPLGPDVVSPSLEELLTAMGALPAKLSWDVVAERVVPLFVRLRPYPPSAPPPLCTVVPPGVSIGFGMDIGPAFVNVNAELLADWSMSVPELTAQAMTNLGRRASRIDPGAVLRQHVVGVAMDVLQADAGIASALVLEPAQLERLFGSAPRIFIAPMRSLLIALPGDTDRDLARLIYGELAEQDPNCLAPLAFVWREGHVSVEALGAAFGEA